MDLPKAHLLKDNPDYCVYHKPPGMLCQRDDSGSKSLFEVAHKTYGAKIHLLNRLDRPVQGVVIFSKSKGFTRKYLQAQEEGRVKKTYLAIVEGMVEQNGECSSLIVHHKKLHKAFITEDSGKGVEARLEYEVMKRLDNYTVLRISLHSGKFHQIRAQLAHIGHPIKGDVKYGARRKNKDRSIYLCAIGINAISESGEIINIETRPASDTLWDLAI